MFAGVGPFSILIARRGKRAGTAVVSCELNDAAFDLHMENNRLNKVEGNVEMVKGDAKELPSLLRDNSRFDRILMPHPSQSNVFLLTALALLKPQGVVHYYRHITGRDLGEAEQNLRTEVSATAPKAVVGAIRKVREIGPRYVELVADVKPT
jgi:tRNA G37 N-methylase Trm5